MRKLSLLLVMALLVVMAVPISAQDMMELPSEHTECELDLTGETITLYHFGDLSGPFAFITQPLVAAFTDAVAYWNDHGGICGATVAQVFDDTGGDLEQTQAFYDRFKADYGDDLDLLLLYASADSELLREQVINDEIPALISAGSVEGLYGEDGQTPGWIFASNPLYVNQFASFCDYVAANPDQFPDPVIGHITWPGAFGEAAATPESEAYCEAAGVDVIDDVQIFLPTDTDILTQVQNLLDEGATILYTNTLASGPALVASTVVDLGMEDDVTLAGVNWVMDVTVGLLGQRALKSNGLPSVDGMLGSMPFLWWSEASHPGIAFITEQADANERDIATRNIAYLISWGSFDYFAELYIQTLNRVGSIDAVTGAEMRETILGLDYEPLGGLWRVAYDEGFRDTTQNRIAVLKFANSDMSGVATSPDDAMIVETDTGGLFIPIVVPLTEFQEVPNVRPGSE